MTTVLLCLGVGLAIGAIGYLAACAAAQRWLTLGAWLARTTCSHTRLKLVSIEWDGESEHECGDCRRRFRRPL